MDIFFFKIYWSIVDLQYCISFGCTTKWLSYTYIWGFAGGSDGKESICNAGDLGLIPGLGRSPGDGNGNPLQYSCLENSMDRGAWWATVHRVAESDTIEWLTLSLFRCIYTFLPAPHSFPLLPITRYWMYIPVGLVLNYRCWEQRH